MAGAPGGRGPEQGRVLPFLVAKRRAVGVGGLGVALRLSREGIDYSDPLPLDQTKPPWELESLQFANRWVILLREL
jgi:hypothetical protein